MIFSDEPHGGINGEFLIYIKQWKIKWGIKWVVIFNHFSKVQYKRIFERKYVILFLTISFNVFWVGTPKKHCIENPAC